MSPQFSAAALDAGISPARQQTPKEGNTLSSVPLPWCPPCPLPGKLAQGCRPPARAVQGLGQHSQEEGEGRKEGRRQPGGREGKREAGAFSFVSYFCC